MTSFLVLWLGIAFSTIGANISQEELSPPDFQEYTIAEIEITNADPLSPRVLIDKFFSVHIGGFYDPQTFEAGFGIIEGLYENLGFIDFKYVVQIESDANEKTLSCLFQFFPGTQFFVNEIHVLGTETGENEIDAETAIDYLLLKRKQIFSLRMFDYSKIRLGEYLENKGFSLEDFRYERSDLHPGTVDIFIRVEPTAE